MRLPGTFPLKDLAIDHAGGITVRRSPVRVTPPTARWRRGWPALALAAALAVSPLAAAPALAGSNLLGSITGTLQKVGSTVTKDLQPLSSLGSGVAPEA